MPGSRRSRKGSPTGRTRPTGRSCRAAARARCSAPTTRCGRRSRSRRAGAVRLDLRARRHARGARARAAGGGGARGRRHRAEVVRVIEARRRPASARCCSSCRTTQPRFASRAALAAECPELVDVVPGHCTVLVTWAGPPNPSGCSTLAEAALRDEPPPVAGTTLEIAVRYDGPDLRRGRRADRALARGGGRTPPAVRVRRRRSSASPRVRLPARRRRAAACAAARRAARARARPAPSRSAASYSGVYPRESPGGWRLIGAHRRRCLFDPPASRPRCSLRAIAFASSRHERDRGARRRAADDGAGSRAAGLGAHRRAAVGRRGSARARASATGSSATTRARLRSRRRWSGRACAFTRRRSSRSPVPISRGPFEVGAGEVLEVGRCAATACASTSASAAGSTSSRCSAAARPT